MSSESDYVFTRDFIDNNRINLGHYQWTELFQYRLHPDIPTTGTNLRIADVATGTAIWLTDMSTRLPTAQLDGLDISLKAAPPAEWLPSNVELREWDLKSPVPDDLVEAYDIVHIRYLAFVLRDEEVPAVLQNILKLLKPGGYLQWGDLDMESFRIDKARAENSTDALERLYAVEHKEESRLQVTWTPKLADIFEGSGGLQDVTTDVRDPPGYLALAMHECSLLAHEGFLQTTKNESIGKAVKELLDPAARESRHGACWAFKRWTVVGRKPVAGSQV